jgi:hypothetical protein
MGSFLTGATGTGNSFAAAAPNLTGQDFTGELKNAQGLFNTAFGNESALGNTLASEAAGVGMSPADVKAQQLNENAIKSNAGTIASMKGINPALAARLAATSGAQMQQQAAGQGAERLSEQQLATQQALANLYGAQANQAGGQQNTLQNALASYNNAQVGATSNQNNVNAGVAAQNASTAGGLVGGALSGISGGLFAKGGVVPKVLPKVQKFADGGAANWGFNMPNFGASDMTSKYISGGGQALQKGLSGLLAPMLKGIGGNGGEQSDDEAQEGYLDADAQLGIGGVDNKEVQAPAAGGPGVYAPMAPGEDPFAGKMPVYQEGQVNPDFAADGGVISEVEKLAPLALIAKGGVIPDHLHHMAKIYHPDFANKNRSLKSKGGKVPGKNEVSAAKNNYGNDKVPAMLSPGEVVIDHETLHDKGPIGKAARMVADAIESRNKSGKHLDDFKDALKQAIGNRRAK